MTTINAARSLDPFQEQTLHYQIKLFPYTTSMKVHTKRQLDCHNARCGRMLKNSTPIVVKKFINDTAS
jgi:hypothetical protein